MIDIVIITEMSTIACCYCVMQDDLHGGHYRDEHHLKQQQNLNFVM